MATKMSVLGPNLSYPPYLRSALRRFPLPQRRRKKDDDKLQKEVKICFNGSFINSGHMIANQDKVGHNCNVCNM